MIAVFVTCLLTASSAQALEDTPENRLQQANRYLKITPPSEMAADLSGNMAKSMPEPKRKEFQTMMTKHLDLVGLETIMREAMVRHFTADELKALADFYGSAVGKSAMKKFGAYMGDVMPKLQQDVMKAFAATMDAKEVK